MTGRPVRAAGAPERALPALTLLALILLPLAVALIHPRPAEVAVDAQGRTCVVMHLQQPDPDQLPPTVVARPGAPSFGPDAYGD
ncbi:MAG: hypothetical protein PW843_10850 [Azospirillaceae bacterium]|nr:hypothetical protein [Azospirillaceae bacterium]